MYVLFGVENRAMKVKETFCSYTDFGDETTKKMTEEISALKNELDKTRNIVRIQRVRYQQLVSLFSAKLREKEEEARNDLQAKHVQLTRILRSLYVLESRLRKEQRVLKTTLNERDALIRTQENEITKLKCELEKIVRRCACARTKDGVQGKSASVVPAPTKPDLISSIGIEILRQDTEDSLKIPNFHSQASEEKTFVIPSIDDYDVSQTTLRVKEPNNEEVDRAATENDENTDRENKRNRIIDERLQSEMRKFKMKDEERDGEIFKTHSPRKILKEVTENPNEKLNGPVLKCIKQILSQDSGQNRRADKRTKTTFKGVNGNGIGHGKGYHPVKPPKPVLKPQTVVSFETNVSNAFLHHNTLTVKPLPKIVEDTSIVGANDDRNSVNMSNKHLHAEEGRLNGIAEVPNEEMLAVDESKIVQTVSALLSDSTESEEDTSIETPPTVSQMVKKFEGLKSHKIAGSKQVNAAAQLISSTDSMVFQTNFEEFHLVDKEIESTCEDIVNDNKATRLEAEGEENVVVSAAIIETNGPPTNNAKYETFLEVTGLSQKSILTPSRILSNHRHVMKPKDVKYRSRVKAAAIGDKYCSNSSSNNNNNNGYVPTSPTIKYWTEPYL